MTEPIDSSSPEYRQRAILFNDITYAPLGHDEYFRFSDRQKIADYLYAQGWRREERPDDATSVPRIEPGMPVAALFTFEQMLDKLDRLERIVNQLHALASEHWDWKAGHSLATRLREVLAS